MNLIFLWTKLDAIPFRKGEIKYGTNMIPPNLLELPDQSRCRISTAVVNKNKLDRHVLYAVSNFQQSPDALVDYLFLIVTWNYNGKKGKLFV